MDWLRFAILGLLTAAVAQPGPARPAPTVGRPAPGFSIAGIDGKTYSLESFRGKWVVLEWYNPSCPHTRKHYESGNLPRLQREWTTRGVVWLMVSTNVRRERAAEFVRRQHVAATAILMDPDAATARAYRARTSPHMFVIDPGGVLVYDGAMDDSPTSEGADVSRARNLVVAALTDGMAGRPIATPTSQPYGCGVNTQETEK
jgi:peroxiredoxin